MKLTVLIPTLPERYHLLKRLQNVLYPQLTPEVEVRINDAGRSMTTGTKRNELIRAAEGEYFCFVDDDDMVPKYYIKELLSAIERGPDVVTFIGYMTTNGTLRQNFTIKLGSKYETVNNHHYRFPNHLACFKKSLVQHVKFPDVHVGEDYAWAKKIHDQRLLKTSVHIERDMYFYLFDSYKNGKPARIR